MKKIATRIGYAVLLVCTIASCSVNPVTGKKELSLMSRQQELSLGKQSDPGIVNSFGMYQDEKLQTFINEKGSAMAKVSHTPDMEFNFRVLDSPVVNAFAVPGGYVYFTRGIMAHFNNEAEFAGVLGHEIGHVTARHSAKQYTNSVLAQVGLVAGVVLVEDFRPYAEMANSGMQMMLLKFGRDHESQSDRLGVEYSTKIGYDSHHMANFFNTLGRLSGGGDRLPTFMSTHPDPADRFQKVGEYTTQWQAKTGATNLEVNRDSYLRMIDGMVYGEDPRQGYVENDQFYHPEMKFQYKVPRNWKTVNSPQQVQMAPENGEALMMFTLGQGKTLQESAQKFVADNKLDLVNSQNIKVNGFETMVITSDQYPEAQQAQGATAQAVSPGRNSVGGGEPGTKVETKQPGKTTGSGPGTGGTAGKGNTSTTGGTSTSPTTGSGRPSGDPTKSGTNTGGGTSPSSPSGPTGPSGDPTQQAPTRGGQTPTVRIMSYFIMYNDVVFAFHGLAKYPEFSKYMPYFSQTMRSFNALSDPAKINVTPDRIRIKTVTKNGSLDSTLRSFGMPQDKLETLSILNGMKLTETVEKGMLIKVLGK